MYVYETDSEIIATTILQYSYRRHVGGTVRYVFENCTSGEIYSLQIILE